MRRQPHSRHAVWDRCRLGYLNERCLGKRRQPSGYLGLAASARHSLFPSLQAVPWHAAQKVACLMLCRHSLPHREGTCCMLHAASPSCCIMRGCVTRGAALAASAAAGHFCAQLVAFRCRMIARKAAQPSDSAKTHIHRTAPRARGKHVSHTARTEGIGFEWHA